MNVLHICYDFWPNIGGVERFVLDLARHSRLAGIDARVLCLNRVLQHKGRLPAREVVSGVPVRRIPFLNLRYYKPAFIPLSELRSADVLHVHSVGAMLDFAVLTKPLHGKPIVLSTHGGIFHTPRAHRMKRAYFFKVSRFMQRHVAMTVACSASDFELFRPIAPKLMLLENGVDVGRFMMARQGAPGRRFLYLGRFSGHKRVDRIIAAFAALHSWGQDFSLRLVGPDDERQIPHLRQLAADGGIAAKTTFGNEVPESQLPSEYQSADYFISASSYEGFGISVIEAMAAGCVPVVNDIPAFRHFISDRKDGFLVDFAQTAQTAGALLEALSSRRETIAANARHRAEAFDWPEKIRKWSELYRDVGS